MPSITGAYEPTISDIRIERSYLGYMMDSMIRPLDNKFRDSGRCLLVCEILRSNLDRWQRILLSGDGFNDSRCFDYFDKDKFSSKDYWIGACLNMVGSDIVWCVSDGTDDFVYLFHTWKQLFYFLGRVKRQHPLEIACHRQFELIGS